MNQDVAELAKKRAADLGLSIGNYLARLVQDDASGLPTRTVDATARLLSEHQAVFDEAEDAADASGRARRVMELHIDVPWILQVAELAGADDPAPDDYGVPVAAVTRYRAELFEQPVYDGPYAKAAALVDNLGRCRWLKDRHAAEDVAHRH